MTAEWVFGIAGVSGTIVMGYWALAKIIVRQFKEDLAVRFQALEEARIEGQKVWHERLKSIEGKQEHLEADVRRILIELPREYVNRADYVRRETVIEAKIDQLSLRIQNWILERANA